MDCHPAQISIPSALPEVKWLCHKGKDGGDVGPLVEGGHSSTWVRLVHQLPSISVDQADLHIKILS